MLSKPNTKKVYADIHYPVLFFIPVLSQQNQAIFLCVKQTQIFARSKIDTHYQLLSKKYFYIPRKPHTFESKSHKQ